MEASVKDFARAKRRLTKHRNRVHSVHSGGGPAPAAGKAKRENNTGLGSNLDRFDLSDEDEEDVNLYQAQGADLGKLLEEAQNNVTTRSNRHWTMLRALADDQVPGNIGDVFKDVALDLHLLDKCLQFMPLTSILGLHPDVLGESAVSSIITKQPQTSPSAPHSIHAELPNNAAQVLRGNAYHNTAQFNAEATSDPKRTPPRGPVDSATVQTPQNDTRSGITAAASPETSRPQELTTNQADLDEELDNLLAGGSRPFKQKQYVDQKSYRGPSIGSQLATSHQRQPMNVRSVPATTGRPQSALRPPKKTSKQELEDWLDL